MKLLLSFFISSFFIISAQASPGQLSVKGGTWSFTTENVRSTSDSASGVGAYAFEIGYSFSPSWLMVFGFNLIMSDIYTGSAGYGFDLGAKYFPLTDASSSRLESEYATVSVYETWRPYIGVFMRQRLFGLALSTSYLGPGLSLGLDYSLSSQWILSAEFRYDYLYGQGDALAVQNNILVGLGFEF